MTAQLHPHFIDLARSADLVALVESYGVTMNKQGRDYFGLCPFHTENTPSFTVYSKQGVQRFHCHGCGSDGDPIQFVQDYEGVPFPTAVRRILGETAASGNVPAKAPASAKPAESEEVWTPVMPVPDSAPMLPDTIRRKTKGQWVRLTVSRRWAYLDANGDTLGYVFRFDLPGGGKEVMPLVWAASSTTGELQWRWMSFPKPRPMYGLDRLAEHPNAQVIVVEGEKAADAGQQLFLDLGISMDKLVVVSWPGGGKAIKHTDFSPLSGRSVGLWPDADQKPYPDSHERAGVIMPFLEQPGTVAMLEIRQAIRETAARVKFILPPANVPDGWDLADPLPAGFNLLRGIKRRAMAACDVEKRFSPNPSLSAGKTVLPVWLVPSTDPAELRRAAFAADVCAMDMPDIANRIDPRGVRLWPFAGTDGLRAAIEEVRQLLPAVHLRAILPAEMSDEAVEAAEAGGVSVKVLPLGECWVENMWRAAGLQEPQPADDEADPAERDEARRQQQKEENQRIQELHDGAMFPSRLTVDEMLGSVYWVAEGEMVAYVSDSRTMFLKFSEFRSLTAESVTFLDDDGARKKKSVPNAVVWKGDPRRMNVMAPTFRAGAGIVCADPDGRRAVNIWRSLERWETKADIGPFLEHVEYLIEDETEREVFLDWLAHLEQKPGELPHYGWLHIASHTGCGRNWLASVLARVWRGYVAPNVDLHALLDSPYNGVLSGRVLAMVDEIQAGDGSNYRHKNRLREMLNQEVRNMNPKFGRQYSEHNSCRWLVFSNHLNALPIDNTDRRWRVVVHTKPPRPTKDYEGLYALLHNYDFINAVAVFLRDRDISHFKPGERPPMNRSKLAVVAATKSPMQQLAEEVVNYWPADVITNADVVSVLSSGDDIRQITPAMRNCMGDLGSVSYGHQVKIHGYPHRVWIIRGHDRLNQDSERGDVSREAMRAREPYLGQVGDISQVDARRVLEDAIEKATDGASKLTPASTPSARL